VQKLRLTTTNLPAGTYRLGYYCECWQSSVIDNVNINIEQNDAVLIANFCKEPKDTIDRLVFSGFDLISLTGVHTFDMDFSAPVGGTSYIKNARFELWRIV